MIKTKNILIRFLVRVVLLPYVFFSFLFLRHKKLWVITGADSTHFKSMLQLINSLNIFEKSNYNLVVYDLGLSIEETEYFKRLHPAITLIKFDYSKFPAFYNIKVNAGCYAWKPAIIKEEYQKLAKGSFILWLDAGCFVRKRLLLIRASLYFKEFYSPFSAEAIKKLTIQQTILALGAIKQQNKKMLSGGIVGFRSGTLRNNNLIEKWFKASQDINSIAPEGSTRDNHRYDQSLLSLLYYNVYNIGDGSVLAHKWLEVIPHKNIG
jgi:hypothetical protein